MKKDLPMGLTYIPNPRIIIQDGDSHNYLIPETERDNFEEWCYYMENCEKTELDFNKYRIDRIDSVKILFWEIE